MHVRQSKPVRVLILGGGYGGVYTALGLQGAARRGDVEITLVSRENYFLFMPLLAEVVSGSIEPPHILNPIRRISRHINFHQAEVREIDIEQMKVTVASLGSRLSHELEYDHLVIALGSATELSMLPGLAEHSIPFRTLGDALHLRNHIIGCLELAEVERDADEKRRLLTFAVCGAGYTGVEVAGEMHDFSREAVGSYSNIDPSEIRTILIQRRGRILPELESDLADFSQKVLEKGGIEVLLNTRISAATAGYAMIEGAPPIPTATLVACIGAAPNPLLSDLPCRHDERGRVEVDRQMRLLDYENVWAVGDNAAIPDARTGGTYGPTAQNALRQAGHVAKNIIATLEGRLTVEFEFKALGVFVPLGRRTAVAQVAGFKLAGFPAWWLYRSYYLLQLPRLDRKLKVILDWTMDMFFNRDIVKYDIVRSERATRSHLQPGDIVYQQGDIARRFYVVLEGEVDVVRMQDGAETPIATLGAGEFFGEMSLIRGTRRSATVRVSKPTNLLALAGEDFTALTQSSARFHELLEGVVQEREQDIHK